MGHRDSPAKLSGAGGVRAAGSGTGAPAAQYSEHWPENLSVAARALLFAVRVYQAFFSVLMPSACKFYPSCSHYAAEAVRIHGARRGSWLALRRLLRCHPFTPGGVDLVPDAADFPDEARSRTSLTACGKTQIFVIPRRAARRGISLFLCSNQREIPHFVRNDKTTYFFRSMFSLSRFESRTKKDPQTEVCATKEVRS